MTTTPVFDPNGVALALRDRTPDLVGGKRSSPTIAVASAGARWLYCLHAWVTPASGAPSFVHVRSISEVHGELADVARELTRRSLYALRVVVDVPVADASTFLPMSAHVVNLGDDKMLDFAIQRQHALFALESLPPDVRLVQALLDFDGTRPIDPYVVLAMLVAVGYGPTGESATAGRAAAPEGAWINGRRSSEYVAAGSHPYGAGGISDRAFLQQLAQAGTFRPTK